MKRLEIIGNRSIEEDLFDMFKKNNVVNMYTKIPAVHGVGSSGPRMGDHTWPEENFLIIVYCDEKEADIIKNCISEIKLIFRDEGVKMFESELICSV
ncbi:MAG TPA: hypothetical protein PK385_12315 [Spirochaetota bacterium]|nr:hypothetical protein [Spirochaetota bacterium]HOS33986.1 hypothetical protein [Spirochaetota bacterium]HOS56828.1 hypothetical protein [Spirochaetota bacterium]HQF78535.1 hypothetical protein [Spirochaetota bacterium]HQH30690.1 hypothetical protein [Spirochaetota bacterium]